jgi:hypothetical protein
MPMGTTAAVAAAVAVAACMPESEDSPTTDDPRRTGGWVSGEESLTWFF